MYLKLNYIQEYYIKINRIICGKHINLKELSPFPCHICEGCLRNKSWKPECVGSFSMDWQILVFYPKPEVRDKIY